MAALFRPLTGITSSISKHGIKHIRCNSLAALKKIIDGELDSIQEAGTWKHERVITSRQAASIKVAGRNDNILNFCANNYLGLSSHPEVVEAGHAALTKYGAGLSSARFICGTQDIHKELEEKLAKFHDREAAILYASCFDANAGLFEVILGAEDAVISDELNHASIIDGIRLCKARRLRYKHTDVEDLEARLVEAKDCRLRLIATDGVFSMDGSVTPLDKMAVLAENHDALIFVDDCHTTGFFGPTGRGTEDHFGLHQKVDILNSTLGKALGGASGGYTTGPKQLIDLLRNRSRPYLYSNTLPPPIVGCAIKVLDMLMAPNELLHTVLDNTQRFRSRMTDAGFTVSGDPEHPICPVMLGDARLAATFANKMLERGIYVVGFSYPVVSKGKARIRVQLSASHTRENVDQAVDCFIAIGRELNVIS